MWRLYPSTSQCQGFWPDCYQKRKARVIKWNWFHKHVEIMRWYEDSKHISTHQIQANLERRFKNFNKNAITGSVSNLKHAVMTEKITFFLLFWLVDREANVKKRKSTWRSLCWARSFISTNLYCWSLQMTKKIISAQTNHSKFEAHLNIKWK